MLKRTVWASVCVMTMAFVSLMLGNAALAQNYYTLPEVRAQAAQGWHETYADKYGRTIPVDIEIDVFGGDKAPVLLAGFPDYVEYRHSTETDPSDLMINAREKRGGQTVYIIETENGAKIELDKAYGEEYGSDLTPQDVYDFFGDALEQNGILRDRFLYEHPDYFKVRCSTHKKTGEVLVPVNYVIRLWPMMYGLPVMTPVSLTFEKFAWLCFADSYGNVSFLSDEVYSIVDIALEEKAIIAEDIPLCSVKRVMEGTRKLIESGHIQRVNSLRFGYAIYNDPAIPTNKPVSAYEVENWYLVPSWVLECEFSSNPKKDWRDDMPPRELVINAQTGELIDPFDTSVSGRGDARYKGFISWDDVK